MIVQRVNRTTLYLFYHTIPSYCSVRFVMKNLTRIMHVFQFIGMMKLLQRLPDATKEEVRNQIIVLLNQMTATNEEMKKTVGKR